MRSSRSRRIASGLLAAASVLAVARRGPPAHVAAFVPSRDGHKAPTSHSYTSGGDAPPVLSPFGDVLKLDPSAPEPRRIRRQPQQEQQQQKQKPAVHDRDPLDLWGKLRLGLGTGPGSSETVFWVGEGAVYDERTGRRLALFEGFDVARGVRLGPDRVRQISRKVFWFRDLATEEILTEHRGKPVRPIMYDKQVIDYFRRPDGSVGYSVEASSRALKGGTPPDASVTSQTLGPRRVAVQVPVFVDVPLPEERGGGRYRAWEFYDFACDPSFPPDAAPSAAWTRRGPCPPFTDGGAEVVMRFAGRRVDRYGELPARMREEVGRACPQFRGPPRDDEVGVRL